MRYIEVKGVSGRFVPPASVLLSRAQLLHGLREGPLGPAVWLYVVEQMETSRPRVLPIRWPRAGELEFGFLSTLWLGAVSDAAEVDLPVDDQDDREQAPPSHKTALFLAN